MNESSRVLSSWCCPSCKPKKPKGDIADTPRTPLHGEDSDDEVLQSVAAAAPSPGLGDESSLLLVQFKEVREEIRTLRLELQSYRNEIAELKSAVSLSSTRLGNMETRVDSLEGKLGEFHLAPVKELELTVMNLRQELNERDQLALANDVEISNLPEEAGENASHLALLIGAKLNVKLEDRDLIYAERVGQKREASTILPGDKPRPRALVIRFTRRALRDEFLQAARVRREITSADLGPTGESRRFYVNERLSKHNRQVFFKARQLGREHNWKYIWTRSGIIYARQAQGKTAYRVTNLDNLNRIFGID